MDSDHRVELDDSDSPMSDDMMLLDFEAVGGSASGADSIPHILVEDTIDDEDIDVEDELDLLLEHHEDIQLMLEQHDDPAMNVLYMETRRSASGTVDDTTLADGLLLLDEEGEDMKPIAPRRESVDSPMEDWDMEFGMDEEIKGAQQEMASGFRSLIGRGMEKGTTANEGQCNDIDEIENESFGNILNEELRTIQSTMPELDVPVTIPNRCKLVSQLLFGSETDNVDRISRRQVPPSGRGAALPDLVSICDDSGKPLKLTALEVDRLLREVVGEKDIYYRRQGTTHVASNPERVHSTHSSQRELPRSDEDRGVTCALKLGVNVVPNGLDKKQHHKLSSPKFSMETQTADSAKLFSPASVQIYCEKINILWNSGHSGPVTDGNILKLSFELYSLLYTYCDRSQVGPSTELATEYGWPSASLLFMFKQLYGVLEVLVLYEYKISKMGNSGTSDQNSSESLSTAPLSVDLNYRFVLFTEENNVEESTTPAADTSDTTAAVQFDSDKRPSLFLDMLVTVASMFPWCIADLAHLELRAAACCLANAYETSDTSRGASENCKLAGVPSAAQLMTHYLQLARYGMGTLKSQAGESVLHIPTTQDRLIHMENARVLDLNKHHLRTSISDQQIVDPSEHIAASRRSQHHRSRTWSNGSRGGLDKGDAPGEISKSMRRPSLKGAELGDAEVFTGHAESTLINQSCCGAPSVGALFFACSLFSDIGLIIQGIVPLTLLPSRGLLLALSVENLSQKASNMSGEYRRFGSSTYVLDTLFYRRKSLHEENSSSDGSPEDTDYLDDLAATSDAESEGDEDDLSLELIIEPNEDVVQSSATKGIGLTIGVPKLNLPGVPTMPSTRSVFSNNSSGSPAVTREKAIHGVAATQKLLSLTPRSLSNTGQPLSARSARSLSHGPDMDSSILTHQNLFSDDRILQSVTDVLLHSSCSDRDCLRYLFKNCVAAAEQPAFLTPAKGKSKGGGGAEMIYIFLSSIYKKLPNQFDMFMGDSGVPTFPSAIVILLSCIHGETTTGPSETLRGASGVWAGALFRPMIENIKCRAAAALAALAGKVDAEITDVNVHKSDSYLLESIYIMNYGWVKYDDCTGENVIPHVYSDSDSGRTWTDGPTRSHPFSPLGAALTEQLGDAFLRAGKYKLAILSYESCLMIHIRLSTTLDKKIYRKLSLVAQEAGEIRRSLFYNCIILTLTQLEGNINEFIYVAIRTAKLCVDVGEVLMAERFLKVANLIHLGLSLANIKFEKVNLSNLPCHLLPHGLKIPAVYNGATEVRAIGSVLKLSMRNIIFCDSIQIDILMQLCGVLVLSHRHVEVVAICQVLLSDQNLPFISRFIILMKMASSFYSAGKFLYAEATLNAICRGVDRIIRTAASKKVTQSQCADINPPLAAQGPISEARKSEIIDDFHGQLLAIVIRTSSGVSSAVSRLKTQEYLLLRARTSKALKKYELAVVWLDLLLLSATAATDASSGKSSIHGAAVPVPLVSPSTKGLVLYLMGRCHALAASEFDSKAEDSIIALNKSPIDRGINLTAFQSSFSKAERCYLECIEVYRSMGDTVRECKACHRWTELYIAFLFDKIILASGGGHFNYNDVDGAHPGDKNSNRAKYVNNILAANVGEHVVGLDHIDTVSRHGLLLAGECGSPMLSMQSMLACAELALIQEKGLFALNCWREVYVILSVTYLQPLASDARFNSFSGNEEILSSAAYESIPSTYTSLREPLEVPCRFSYSIIVKLLDVLRRLIRLAFFLPASTQTYTTSSVVPASSVDTIVEPSSSSAIEKSLSFEEGARATNLNFNCTSPLSLHSQLTVSMHRLENLSMYLKRSLQVCTDRALSQDNKVLSSYIGRYLQKKHITQIVQCQYLVVSTETRLLDTLFEHIGSPECAKMSSDVKYAVAGAAAAAVDELYPLEIQRLALCSDIYSKSAGTRPSSVVRWEKENTWNKTKRTALSVIAGAMQSNITNAASNIDSILSSRTTKMQEMNRAFVSSEGTVVTFLLSAPSRNGRSPADQSTGSGNYLLHFSEVTEAASQRYAESERCLTNKRVVADFLVTVNDIYSRPCRDSIEFTACVSRSHQRYIPIFRNAYSGSSSREADWKFDINVENTSTGRNPGSSGIPDHSILMTVVQSDDFLKGEAEVKVSNAALLGAQPGSCSFKEPKNIKSKLPHVSDMPSAQTIRNLHKADIAVPVAIAFKSSQPNGRKWESENRFKMKKLIPRGLRKAFMSSASAGKLDFVYRNVGISSPGVNLSNRHLDSRRADWDMLFRNVSQEDNSVKLNAIQKIDIAEDRHRSTGPAPIVTISSSANPRTAKGRLDALYESFRFYVLFIRLHAQMRQRLGNESNSISDMPMMVHTQQGMDLIRGIDRLMGLSNSCSASISQSEENSVTWANQLRQSGKIKVHPSCVDLRRKQMSILRVFVKQCNRYATVAVKHENNISVSQTGATTFVRARENRKGSLLRRNTSENSLSAFIKQSRNLRSSSIEKVADSSSPKNISPMRISGVYKGSMELSHADLARRQRDEKSGISALTNNPPLFQGSVTSKSNDSSKPSLHRVVTHNEGEKPEVRQRSSSQSARGAYQPQLEHVRRYTGTFSPLICPTYYNTGNGDALTPLYPSGFFFFFYIYPCFYVFFPESGEKYVFHDATLAEHSNDIFFLIALRAGQHYHQRKRWNSLIKLRLPKTDSIGVQQSVDTMDARADDCMSVLFRIIGVDKLILLLNCVLFEQSVLFVAPPGSEELISKCVLGLYDFCCGHVSEYVYIPLICPSVVRMWVDDGKAFHHRIPFITGTYQSILDAHHRQIQDQYLWQTFNQEAQAREKIGLFCPYDADNVTVVDILTGNVWPGRRMHFAATMTAAEWMRGDVSCRCDDHLSSIDHILSRLQELNPNTEVSSYFPPIPPKHRDMLRARCIRFFYSNESKVESALKLISNQSLYFLTNIYTAMSDMLSLALLFCKAVFVLDDGYVCECSRNCVGSEIGDSGEVLPVIVIRTATETLFDVTASDSDTAYKLGKFKRCAQYSTPAVMKILAGCCAEENIKFKRSVGSLRRKLISSQKSSRVDAVAKSCLCCEFLNVKHMDSRKRRLMCILFNDDAFLEHSTEMRHFVQHLCRQRNFEQLIVSSLCGDKCNVKFLNAKECLALDEAAPETLPSARVFVNRTYTLPCFYPSSQLQMMMSVRLAVYERIRYKRLAGYLYVCVAKLQSDERRNQSDFPVLSHAFPVEILPDSTISLNNESDSPDFDVDLGTTQSPSAANCYGHRLGKIRITSFKKRWCVIDGFRLSYYKQKSDKIVKGSVILNSDITERWRHQRPISLLVPASCPQMIGDKSVTALKNIPVVFGLDCHFNIESLVSVNTTEDSNNVRTLLLFYSPTAPYSVTSSTPDGTYPAAFQAPKQNSGALEKSLFPCLDTDTNRWMGALYSRLGPRPMH